MAGRADIEAGRSHVRIYLKKNDLLSGLASVGSTIKTWTLGIGKAFAVAGGIGTGLIASLVFASKKFSKGIKELREDAAKLGRDMPEDAKRALALGNAWDRVKESAGRLALTIVGAVGPTIENLLGIITNAVDAITEWVDKNRDLLSSLEGITEALAEGKWALAGRIAIAALRTVVLGGLVALQNSISNTFGDMLGKLGAQITGGDFAGAWDTAVLGMTTLWDSFAQNMVNAFTAAADAIVNVWQAATTAIANFILENQKQLKVFADTAVLAVPGGPIWQKISGTTLGESVFGPDVNPGDIRAAQSIAAQQLEKRADIVRKELEAVREAAKFRAEASAAALRAGVKGGASPALDAAVAELIKLNAEAMEGFRILKGPGGIDAKKLRDDAAVTFSARGLVALGQGGATRTLVEIRDEIRKRREENKHAFRGFVFS